MAFTTGTAFGSKALLDAIVGFATSLGWTLHDSVSSTDYVIKSPGSDGKQNLIYRLSIERKFLDFKSQTADFSVGELISGGTSGATARVMNQTDNGATGTLSLIDVNGLFIDGEPLTGNMGGAAVVDKFVRYSTWNSRTNAHNASDWIIARGYSRWDAVTDTGYSEYSTWGPWMMLSPNSQNSSWAFWRMKGGPSVLFNDNYETSAPLNGTGEFFSHTFDGIRRIWTSSSVNLRDRGSFYDISHHSNTALPYYDYANYNDGNATWNRSLHGTLVFDKANDRWYYYQYGNAGGGGSEQNKWSRLNFDTFTWELLAAPNISVNSDTNGARTVWDGNDYIYALNGSGATTFKRYSISQNAWFTLATAPVGFSNIGKGQYPFYIPAGTIPGVDEDIIFFYHSGTLYRYNVKSDTWGGGNINVAEGVGLEDGRMQVYWDEKRYLYNSRQDGTSHVYRLDLQNVGAGWTFFAGIFDTGMRHGARLHQIDHFVGKIRSRAESNITYWLEGSLDHINVVTKVSGHYYWMYIGKIDSFYKEGVMTLTAPANATAGVPTTVAVDSTTGFVAGDPVVFVDPATGDIDAAPIVEVVDGTSFKAYLKKNLSTGTRVTVDGTAAVITGDSGLAVANFDGGGYEDNKDANCYRIKPLVESTTTARGVPGARGAIQFWPWMVYMNQPNLSTYENRGQLKGAFALHNGVAPAPQSEDVISDGVNQYKVFKLYSTYRSTDDRALVIGPI